MKIEIKVLYIEGCDQALPTVELLELVIKMANEMDFDIDLVPIKVMSQEQAEELHFIGSPSVQINGLDIDPSARNIKIYGLT